MDSAGIGRDRKWRRPRARSDASRSTNRLLLADQGKEWCKLQMAGVPPVIELSRLVFEVLRKDEEFVLCRGRSKDDSSQAASASRLRTLRRALGSEAVEERKIEAAT